MDIEDYDCQGQVLIAAIMNNVNSVEELIICNRRITGGCITNEYYHLHEIGLLRGVHYIKATYSLVENFEGAKNA